MDYSKLSDQELEKLAFGKGPRFKDESVKQEYSGLEAVPKAILAESTARVTSGKRTPETNKAVGGVPTSFHLTGKAFDLGKDESALPVIEKAKNYGYNVLDEGDHYHFQPQKGGKINYSALSKSELEQLAFDGPPPIPQQAAQEKKPELMGAPEASLRGAASAVPFSGTVSGALRTIPAFRAMAQILGGNLEEAPKEYEKGFFGFDPSQFSRGRESFNVKEKQAAQDQPVAYTLTKLAAELPQYIAGGEALKAIPALSGTGLIPAMGRGAISNVGVSQVHDFDPAAAPWQALFGSAGEAAGVGFQKGVQVLKEPAKKLGIKLIAKALNRTPTQMAKYPGLEEEMYNRGIWGTLKGIMTAGKEGVESNEAQLQDVLSQVGQVSNAPSIKELEALKTSMKGIKGSAVKRDIKEIDTVIKELKSEVPPTASEANITKREIYKRRKSAYGKDAVPLQTDIEKAQARGLREGIEVAGIEAGHPEISKINQELLFQGKMEDAAERAAMLGSKKDIFNWKDLLFGVGAGSLTQDPYIGAAVTGGKALGRSALGRTGGAQAIKSIVELLDVLSVFAPAAGRGIGGATTIGVGDRI